MVNGRCVTGNGMRFMKTRTSCVKQRTLSVHVRRTKEHTLLFAEQPHRAIKFVANIKYTNIFPGALLRDIAQTVPFLWPRNPYPAYFLRMHEMVQQASLDAERAGRSIPSHALRFSGGVAKDPRTYNKPSAAEVSCTVVGNGPLPPHFISVYERAAEGYGSTHELSYLSEHVDPLTYPIVHFQGDLGYSHALHAASETNIDAETSDSQKTSHVTLREFYAHRLMQRYCHDSGVVELPHACGRLFQQYLVDAYVKLESQRLDWVLQNQTKLRVDTLHGLLDFLESADDDSQLTGKPVILPASFGGSPRSLHQAYLDSMAIVSRFGKPDFFITMTANPSWPEILANLRPGETAADRPDLVARVFHAKLTALLKVLTKDHYLGRAVGWTFVIEFQKRGLPHAHILLIVRGEDKPMTPQMIDELVSAEIPDPITQASLYRLVETHMARPILYR